MNGDLEEVYMELSTGFDQGRKVRKVYKMRKSLWAETVFYDQPNHTLFYHHNDGKLAAEFETKDLRPLRYFLGMEMARKKSEISVS
ncbi:hypothetical protein AAG906_024598 [Vitis piasezkii]